MIESEGYEIISRVTSCGLSLIMLFVAVAAGYAAARTKQIGAWILTLGFGGAFAVSAGMDVTTMMELEGSGSYVAYTLLSVVALLCNIALLVGMVLLKRPREGST